MIAIGPGFAKALAEGTLPPKSPAGIATTALSTRLRAAGVPPLRDNPVAYVEYCRSLGAGGIQHLITTDLPAVRKRLDELGMYYEGQVQLPTRLADDLSTFENSLRASAALGATVARAVSRPPQGGTGRRYESFKSLAEYRTWQAEADAIVERCLPLAEKYKVAIALENHKDRTVEEHVGFLRRFSSPWLGSLIDPGNNMSFMEDPIETVTALAPWVKATSLKDMGVALYEDGFLLAEVPFGTGMTDQKALFAIMRKAFFATRSRCRCAPPAISPAFPKHRRAGWRPGSQWSKPRPPGSMRWTASARLSSSNAKRLTTARFSHGPAPIWLEMLA
ncbi:sugar phosphate isomerase/epimerase family protein [Polymorphobacter multimanifer]|uniref:sugar phosphate isomerase/epimerase family protein n=1 Tax=Polymorphobacter multimanifer TaxID=1070431 RepID=UPI0016684338|nr:TIM barrel protein [Polymorphobacter multimanifer]